MSELFRPVFIYLVVALGFVLFTMAVTHRFPRVRKTKEKLAPYESGMEPVDDARRRYDVRYYRIAIDFLIFDVEVLLLFPGAVAFGQKVFSRHTFGVDMLAAFVGIVVFMVLLVVGYVYSWRKGSFKWR